MTRRDLLTVGTARSLDIPAPGRERWTCDDESYWGTPERDGSTMVRGRTSTRRSVAPRDSRRPDAGSVEYRRRSDGVSQVEHRAPGAHGVATGIAVALITAMSVLGLVGLANMRAADAPAQPSVSQQIDAGVSAR